MTNSADQPRSARRHRRSVAEDPSADLQHAGAHRRSPARRARPRRVARPPRRAHLRRARCATACTFHDGRELTSADVVYTFRSFLDPTFTRRARARIAMLAGGQRASIRYTVAFKLKKPLGSFPINLVMGIVQDGSGAANARVADRHRTVPVRRVRAGRSRRAAGVRRLFRRARRSNDGAGAEGGPRRHHARARAAQGHASI